jgi:hypothetical protein
MKTLFQRGVLLFGVLLAVGAFVPSMASAASWATIGTTHQLFSSNLTLNALFMPGSITIGMSCPAVEFDVDVASAAGLEITSGRFKDCSGTGVAAGCTVTPTATGFPWTATVPDTTNIQIHGINVALRFENAPSSVCTTVNGLSATWTGTLTGGSWDPSGVGIDRRVTFVNDSGTVIHNGANALVASVSGTFSDTTGTLNVFM